MRYLWENGSDYCIYNSRSVQKVNNIYIKYLCNEIVAILINCNVLYNRASQKGFGCRFHQCLKNIKIEERPLGVKA